jgi:TorA maturation chaperone TorD
MLKTAKTSARPAAAAEMAAARSNFYDLMVEIFNQLPDKDFLSKIRQGMFEEIFDGFSGVAYLKSYRSQMEAVSAEIILNELAVDRTRILRGTGPKELKPPYEGCYKLDCHLESAAINVRHFYRTAGLLPDASVSESPDYICVQLDFMKQLCSQELRLWSGRQDATATIVRQKEFLKNHLGSWAGDYCQQVRRHALTDFYRGFAVILDTFIALETEYLDGLIREYRMPLK